MDAGSSIRRIVGVLATCLLQLGLAGCGGARAADFPLTNVKDVGIGAPTRRFDYASVDPKAGLLFFADLAGGRVLVFDVRQQRLVKVIEGVPSVHGVLAVPELGRLYASATGAHQTVAIDEHSLQVTARASSGRYPDGIAWDPRERKIYVSDESGGAVAVIGAAEHQLLKLIPAGGEVGNTQYDPASGLIYSNVQTKDELVAIDPRSDKIVSRHPVPGCKGNHGLLIDSQRRLAFIACEDNAKLVVLSLATHAALQQDTVGEGPDVLAYDPGLHRLYVASESGVVSVFQVEADKVQKLGEAFVARNAHVVAVDPTTHEVFLPLRNVGGKAVLRILRPK
jgi:DNA-binding beta-propeller fold protein YncE